MFDIVALFLVSSEESGLKGIPGHPPGQDMHIKILWVRYPEFVNFVTKNVTAERAGISTCQVNKWQWKIFNIEGGE